MEIEIKSTPVFQLPLRKLHIDILMTLSEHHYDGTCKMASRVGGFLYGWKNQIDWREKNEQDEECMTVNATMHELGLCCKMLEMTIYLYPDRDSEEGKAARDMVNSFSGAFSLANDKYSEWQTKFIKRKGA